MNYGFKAQPKIVEWLEIQLRAIIGNLPFAFKEMLKDLKGQVTGRQTQK
jgi:hypothetical protein